MFAISAAQQQVLCFGTFQLAFLFQKSEISANEDRQKAKAHKERRCYWHVFIVKNAHLNIYILSRMRHDTAWKLWYKKERPNLCQRSFDRTAFFRIQFNAECFFICGFMMLLSEVFLWCVTAHARQSGGRCQLHLSFACVVCANFSLLKCRTNEHNSLSWLHSNAVFYSTCKCLTSALPVVLSERPHTF